MATEKRHSKARLLHLFDWNAKSRKKLFSNKFESSEGPDERKEEVDDLMVSQLLLRELRENGNHSIGNRSYNYSCTSSENADDGFRTRAPGVVARLMGLDSLPVPTSCETSSVSSYEFCAASDSYNLRGPAALQHGHADYHCTLDKLQGVPWNFMDSRPNRFHGLPIERFQTEVLPPKSAKPISITHHKLLSPIKNPAFVPSNDASYIIEAAARIIDSTHQPTAKVKHPSLTSPSSSLKVRDLKERMVAAQRSSRIPESSKTSKQLASLKAMRQSSSDRSTNVKSKNSMSSEMNNLHDGKNKGKLVCLDARSRTDVQKKEGSTSIDNRHPRKKGHKQAMLKHDQTTTEDSRKMKSSRNKGSSVLRQNNEKQNGVSHKDKSTSKAKVSKEQPRKATMVANSARPNKIVNKVFVNADSGSKMVVSATIATEKRPPLPKVTGKRPLLNRMNNISRDRQFTVRDCQFDKSLAENVSPDSNILHKDGDCRKDMDVISFTFTSPIKSGSQSRSSNEPTKYTQRRSINSYDSNGQSSSEDSTSSHVKLKSIDGGSLNLLLEQKLKELTNKIELTNSISFTGGIDNDDSVSCFSDSVSTHDAANITLVELDELSDNDVTKASQGWKDFEVAEDHYSKRTDNFDGKRETDVEHLNIFIPECSVSGSCLSDSTSDCTNGYHQPLSPQSLEVVSCMSSESLFPREDEMEIADMESYWALEYVRHTLRVAGLKDLGPGENNEIIDPGVFDLLENLTPASKSNEVAFSKLWRKLLFDCVAECVTLRYERLSVGSYNSWVKWRLLFQNECLAEAVYEEIIRLQNMGNLMVDELVDRDMSTQYGRWVDFEIESLEEGTEIEEEILACLLGELVVDLLL